MTRGSLFLAICASLFAHALLIGWMIARPVGARGCEPPRIWDMRRLLATRGQP